MKCKITKSDMEPFMSFGPMPIANGFLKKEEFEKEFFFDMDVGFSEKCSLFQLKDHPTPKQMFNSEYPFFTGSSEAMKLHFKNFAVKEISKYSNFPNLLLIKQSVTYLILKVLSITFLYKILFFRVVKYAHLKNNLFLLKIFYPSLKFSQKKFPSYYFTKISDISKKLVYLQLQDLKSRALNHKIRKTKNIYYQQELQKKCIKGIKLLLIRDFNFQNLIDFPILVKD